ncbi:hypothetical protein PG984_014599 [Apiospora sp. TS-2023a]
MLGGTKLHELAWLLGCELSVVAVVVVGHLLSEGDLAGAGLSFGFGLVVLVAAGGGGARNISATDAEVGLVGRMGAVAVAPL